MKSETSIGDDIEKVISYLMDVKGYSEEDANEGYLLMNDEEIKECVEYNK